MITKNNNKLNRATPKEEPMPEKRGLIDAKGVLAEYDNSLDEMINLIYKAREKETSRKVPL